MEDGRRQPVFCKCVIEVARSVEMSASLIGVVVGRETARSWVSGEWISSKCALEGSAAICEKDGARYVEKACHSFCTSANWRRSNS